MKLLTLTSLTALLILTACAPARFVEPLQKKEIAVGTNFGGPVINQGITIPIPLTAIEIGYGLDTNLTIHGGLHTTALFFGNFQMDAGLTYKVLNQDRYIPNISVNPGFNFIYNFENKISKFWPTVDINAYWNYGKRNSYLYFGFNNMFELSKTMAHEQKQIQRWLFSPQIGHVLKTKNEKWQFTSELKFLALNQDNSYAFLPYKSLTGSYGETGFYLGLRYIIK
jgi:hypothetical protein